MLGLGELIVGFVVLGGAVGVFYAVYRLGYRVGRADGRAEALTSARAAQPPR